MSEWNIKYSEQKEVWDVFVSTSPQRSIFVSTQFLDSLGVDYDLVSCYEKGKIVAGTVVLYSSRGEARTSVFPFTQYQGMLLSDNSIKAAHSQITHDFKVVEYFIRQLTEHYKGCCFCHSWRLADLRPFQWHNYHEPDKGQFKIDLRYTGILDLKKYSNFDEYLVSVRSVRRQEYKKASQTLKVQFSNDVELLICSMLKHLNDRISKGMIMTQF